MKANKMRGIGYVGASPAEFIIHQRLGKLRRQGRGLSVWKWPLIDSYFIVPATTNSISFTADQITAEKQGVEVSGFAIWKIDAPEQTIMNFDFVGTVNPIEKIGSNLKDVVESAIRHQVANMTIEDVLTKRGSIILQLKEELAYIAERWGIAIETVEIKNVRIMSRQVFSNMQAKFRDAVKLESEISSLEMEKQIAESRYSQREQLASREQESRRREAERKAELDRISAKEAAEMAAFRTNCQKEASIAEVANQREVAAAENLKNLELLRLEQKVIALEREVQLGRYEGESESKQHQVKLREMDDTMTRNRIETANQANATLAFINQMPAIAQALQIKELNIGDDTLSRIGHTLTGLLTAPRQGGN